MIKFISLVFMILALSNCATTKSLINSAIGWPKKEIKEVPLDKRIPINQTWTSNNETILTIVHTKDEPIQYTIRHKKSLRLHQRESILLKNKHWKDHPGRLDHLHIKNLIPGDVYEFFVHHKDGNLIDYRTFQGFSPDKKSLSFVVASCLSDNYQKEQRQMWSKVQSLRPDAIFTIGDNVYTDIVNGQYIGGESRPSRILQRYFESRQRVDLFKMVHLIPNFSIWDDHDYGVDNGDRFFQYKKQSLDIFSAFNPHARINSFTSGPGVSFIWKKSGQTFAFLDARYFRDNEQNGKFSHLGKEQFFWLMKNISGDKGPLWLIKGDQFFGGYHPFESFERQNPEGLHFLLDNLRHTKKQVFFISGDRHLAEIIQTPQNIYTKKSFEFTTSGIHSIVFKGTFKKYPNPNQVKGKAEDGVQNFMYFETDTTPNRISIKNQTYGLGQPTPLFDLIQEFTY